MIKHGRYQDSNHERDHQELVDEVNRDSLEPISVTVALPLTEYAVAHNFDVVPTGFFIIITPTSTGTALLFPGPTAWTTKYIYVQSNSTGVYNIIIRK